MRKILVAAAFGVMTLGAVVWAPTSSADVGIMGRVYLGNNYASSNGRWVEVCDMERDGNGVYGLFRTNTGTARVNDGNGSQRGCGNATFGRVNLFRVCEDRSGRPDPCSSWARP
jgi:hypothetical protein